MKKTYIRIGYAGFATAILYFFAIQSVYASTVIGQETYASDRTWDATGSPYVLTKTLTVAPGATLTIKDGVTIISSSTPFGTSGINVSGGKLFIKGKGSSRVQIKGVTNITVTDGYADIVNTDIEGGTGMSFTNSRVRIATSSITKAVQAIKSKESVVSVEGSHIKGNGNGIRVIPAQIFLVSHTLVPDTGGIGNALDGSIPVASPSFSVINSSIAGNTSIALGNFAAYKVEAVNNWWGSSGPIVTGANRVSGTVNFVPALTEEPPLDPGVEEPTCCSSILFIPGFQGTRLHTVEDKLWEPHNNEDVKQLYLSDVGKSNDPDIYAGDAIDKAYGVVGVYDTFLKFLERLRNEKTINEWKVFGYDWRMPVAEVVAGTKRATSTDSLVEIIEILAAKSRTGKVTLIAHSNGGLVTKYLVKTLAELGKEALVDTVVSVAVPYLGTPEAILGLLHGDNQEIMKGIIQESSTARAFGKNMPGVYGLLPSAEYFKKVFSPVIAFASSTIVGVNDGSYPQEILSQNDLADFLLDSKNVRTDTAESNLIHPLKANELVMGVGNALHMTMDPFIWPSAITRFGIIGWNAITTRGLTYGEKDECVLELFRLLCKKVLTHTPELTLMGDATVVSPSASHNTGTQVAMDLKYLSETDTDSLRHATIMQASTTQALIKEMIQHESYPDSFALPPGTTWGEPDYSKKPSLLAVSTHSPVELHLYDSAGRHTGPITAPDEFEPGFVTAFENNIPGSTYRTFGDPSSPQSYIYVPDDKRDTYSVVVQGTGMGVATLEVEQQSEAGNEKISFAHIPVTPLTVLKTSVTSNYTGTVASSTLPLALDADGNGTTDATLTAGSAYDPLLQIELTRKIIKTLLGTAPRGDYIDKKLAKIADQISKGKWPQAKVATEKIVKKIGHLNPGTITSAEKELIIGIIEGMIAQFE